MYKAMLSISMISFLAQIALNIPVNLFAGYEYNGKQCEADGNCSDCEMGTVAVPIQFDPQTGQPTAWVETCAIRGGGTAPANQPAYASCQDSQVQAAQCHITETGPAFSCTGMSYTTCSGEIILVEGQNPECVGCDCSPENLPEGGAEQFTARSGCTDNQ